MKTFIALLLLAGSTTLGSGATFAVTNTTDVGSGSLREAITAANASPGLDTITFNIPGTGPHTIQPLSPLPTITDRLVIDGYTQPGASPNTLSQGDNAALMIELDGTNAGSGAIGLNITAGGSTVRGLVVNRFSTHGIQLVSAGNVISGNFIGTDVTGTAALGNGPVGLNVLSASSLIGGLMPEARNVISGHNGYGVLINGGGGNDNVVQGNFIGTDRTGTNALGQQQRGLAIYGGSRNLIGGVTPEARNVISGNLLGVDVRGPENKLQGNFIGTDVTGTVAVGNSGGGYSGVFLGGSAPNNQIGGTAPGAGNLISGNDGAVLLGGIGVTGTRVQGNLIGTDFTGTQPLGNGAGILVNHANDNIIGGIEAGASNVIAHSVSGNGVEVRSDNDPQQGVRNTVRGNSIFDNCGGINLISIANGNRKFPLLKSATTTGLETSVAGILNGPADTTFALDFYASDGTDHCGYAEGQAYLGSGVVTCDAVGIANFISTLPVAVIPGYLLTATATDPDGNTSAFSAGLAVVENLQAATLTIAQQPLDEAVAEGQSAVFSVEATATPAGIYYILYQWRENGLDIPGANSPGFVIPETTLTQSGRLYDCVLRIPGTNLTTRTALLTVTNDATPLALLSAEGNLTLTHVTLTFSESINTVDATNTVNYVMSGGLSVSNAVVLVDRRTVILTTSPQTPGSNYTVQVSGIRDRSTASNSVVSGSQASFFGWVDEQFVGPFPSWANVKRDYGAVGDGVADDTAALQQALEEVTTPGHSSVLFFPTGTYRITQTLNFHSRLSASLVGDDPITTIIKWDGPTDGDMMFANSVAYSRWTRLTWDGSGEARLAVHHGFTSGSYQVTGNLHTDEIFKDIGTGLSADPANGGDSHTIIRCHFLRCSDQGIAVGSYNAIDWHVWDSLFEDCNNGLHSYAGSFHVYRSLFLRSTVADVHCSDGGSYYGIRGNTSIGSKTFVEGDQAMTIQGNTVMDSLDPIFVRGSGPVVLLDNTFISRVDATDGPVVDVGDGLLSVGNTFTVDHPVAVAAPYRSITMEDKVVSRDSLGIAPVMIPQFLPKSSSPIIEVPAGANVATIQQAIDMAATLNGSRPIVHLPAGNYYLDQTLVVPPNCDLQLVGDGSGGGGRSTDLNSGLLLALRIVGPSHATLRDFNIGTNRRGTGILVDNCDQPGARVFMEHVYLGNSDFNLVVDRLDQTDVSMHDLGHGGAQSVDIRVIGGAAQAAGQATSGRVCLFGGESGGSALTYQVEHGGRLLVEDCWYEGSDPRFMRFTNSGTFTLNNATVAVSVSNPQGTNTTIPAVEIDSFNGQVAFLNTGFRFGPVTVKGDGTGTGLLLVGSSGLDIVDTPWLINQSPNANVKSFFPSFTLLAPGGAIGHQQPDVGDFDPVFLRQMLSQLRTETPRRLVPLPSGVSDIRMYRLSVGACETAMKLTSTTLASRAPFTVTTTDDDGSGSLRAAITAANDTFLSPGLDTILFNIPGTGPHTIQPLSPLPTITDRLVIDGYTQPGASPNTLSQGDNAALMIELDGTNAGSGAIGLNITAGGSTVRGLVVNRFSTHGIQLVSAGNVISGNFIGTDVTGTAALGNGPVGLNVLSASSLIGGLMPEARNVISGHNGYGVLINGGGGNDNVVQGNFIGTDRTGTNALGQQQRGLAIYGGSRNLIGGVTPEARNVISGNLLGVDVRGPENKLQGNFIGTDVTGTVAVGNSGGGYSGVFLGGSAPNNQIGGTAPGAGNLISGNDGAVLLGGIGVTGTRVQGNLIGTDFTGTQPLGNGAGILVNHANDNIIGGIEAGASNVIAHSVSGNGVEVRSDNDPQQGVRNTVRGNSIFDNCGGINLISIANGNRKFPLLKSATTTGLQTSVAGILNGPADTTFALDFYASDGTDHCGYAEGQAYLGSGVVTCDAVGIANFISTLPVAVIPGYLLTATATDPDGNTSAFSAGMIVQAAPQLLNPTLTGATFRVSTPTVSGWNYVLEFKNSLTDSNWTPLPAVAGDGTVKTLTDPDATGPQRFYRLKME